MKLFLSGTFASGKIDFVFRIQRIHFLFCTMPLILAFSTFGLEAQQTPPMEKNHERSSFYNCFMLMSLINFLHDYSYKLKN